MSKKYQFQKGILGVMFCLALLLVCVPVVAYAQEEESTVTTELQTIIPDVELPDNDELFGGYAELNIFGDSSMASTYATLSGDRLGDVDKYVYNALKEQISTVAANGGSTNFEVGVTGKGITYTDGNFNNMDMNRIIDALLTDCPYELYWFDKTVGVSCSGSVSGTEVLKLGFSFTVASAYQDTEKETPAYNVSSTDMTTVKNAKDEADRVITGASEKATIYDKLLYFLDYIKTNVAYGETTSTNKNTWQMIWVFDNDATTNVVCEGYAKAFKYLCDGIDVECYTVTGMMGGSVEDAGGHMWNIVVLNEDESYLVDPTNCDTGSIGSPDKLFLKAPSGGSGTSENPYTYTFDELNSCVFYYDTDTTELLGSEILTLEKLSYGQCTAHTGGTQTCMGYACEKCGAWYGETDANAHGEMDAATGACSNGCGTNLAAAKVGDTYYTDFATALDNWTDGTTLTLLADVTDLTDYITTTAKGLTLDLNGHTLASADTWTLKVDGASELTIRDGKGTGHIDGPVIAGWNSSSGCGTILLESGTLEDVRVDGIFSMTGGTIKNEAGTGVALQVANDSDTVLITGGEIYGSKYGVWITSGNVIISGDTKITGAGQFAIKTFDCSVVISGTPTISGGAGEFDLSSKITLNTQPANSEVWRVKIDTEEITDGVFAIPGEGVTLDASKFTSAMDGYDVRRNAKGELLLCNHTEQTAVSNDDGTHNTTCYCGETTFKTNVACSGGVATDTHQAYCEHCNTPYGELNPDVHCDIVAANMTAEQLQSALTELLNAGKTDIFIILAADADEEMFTAINTALRSSTAADGSINLTIGGVKTIPSDVLGNGHPEESQNTDPHELKTLTLPDAVTLERNAMAAPKLEAVYAPKVTEWNIWAVWNNYEALNTIVLSAPGTITADFTGLNTKNIDLTLNCDKKDAVTNENEWMGETWKSVTLVHSWTDGTCTVCGAICDHSDSQHETANDNCDGKHSFICSICNATVTEDHDSYIYSANGNVISKNCDKCNTAVGTITITAENYTYNGTAYEVAVTKTNIPEDEAVTVAYYKGDTLLDSAPVNAGTYTVKATCGGATASVTLTIAPKAITVTADNASKTYGDADPVFDFAPDGLVGSDTLTGTLSRETGENVGTYAITQGTLTNENNPNYNINFVNGTFTINKATAPAVSESVAGRITYGQLLSASTLNGGWTWANGNVIPMVTNNGYEAVLTVDDANYDYTGVSGYNAATHTVSRTISVDVLKAPLTVTANSYTIKLYEPLPDPLEYTVAGLQGTVDTITNIGANVTIKYSDTATSSALGTYPIVVDGEEETANYAITYINGVLNVVEKLIPTITASDITLTYGDTNKKIGAATNGDGAITYTVATGIDVISVDADGNITVLKAGTATVTINTAETADYAAVAKTVTVTANKAENAPNLPSAAMNASYETKTVGEVTLPTGWAWAENDSTKALTAGAIVTATAVYNGADKGNYENETVSVAITRSECSHSYTNEVTKQPTVDAEGERTYTCGSCGHSYTEIIDKLVPTPTPKPSVTPAPGGNSGGNGGSSGGGYYPPYYPSYPSYPTATPVPTVAPTATPTLVPTETPAPTAAPSATPAPTAVPGTVTVPSSGETVVDENGEEVTSIVQEPGTTNKLVIPGLTDVTPEEGEEATPVVWESSNPDVAEVDENGNITMKEPGLAEITVTVGEGKEAKTETIVVLVEEPRTYVNPLEEAFKDVRLGTSWADIPLIRYQKVGETVDINFWGVKNWKLDNYEYIWKTSDESLATVDSKGRVTALKPGAFDLTLGLKNKTTGNFLNVQSVEIVIPGNYDDKILLGTSRNNTFDSIVLKLNERIDINFYGVKNWKKNDFEYYWSSSEPSVVWVDNLGRLIPVAPGKAEIFLVLVEKKSGAPRYVVPMEVTVPEK